MGGGTGSGEDFNYPGVKKTQEFFLKAMLQGWISGAEETKVPHMPGYRTIPFRDGDLFLLDCYCVNPNSSKSAGTTTIWYRDIPVWIMQYGGFYRKSEISFLKHALRCAYESNVFIGGRGPIDYREDQLLYENSPNFDEFEGFSGIETIYRLPELEELGHHKYWGMYLV